MLEHLFGSRTRVKLLRLFMANPDSDFFVRELTRKIKERINSVRRELENLENAGILVSTQQRLKKFYSVNPEYELFQELKALVIKSQLTLERSLAHHIKDLGQVSYLALTGSFTGVEDAQTDLIVVGKVNRSRLTRLMKKFERDFNKHIRFTVMTRQEFEYRNSLTDKFLYHILESKKIVITDKIFSAS